MRFLEFKQLSQPWQAHLICEHGVYLSERRDGDYMIDLYALFDFYVEVHHRFLDSEVVMIGSFFTTSLLEPYLAKIPIGNLLQTVFR